MIFTTKQRMTMAAKGQALADGSFPINSKQSLLAAIHLVGNAKDPKAAKAHIIASAKALGMSNLIPPAWLAFPGAKPTPAAGSPAKGTVPAGLAAWQAARKAGTATASAPATVAPTAKGSVPPQFGANQFKKKGP